MNLLLFNHNIPSLYILSFKVYKKNFISILILTIAIMTPAILIGFAGWSETESIIFFLSAHVLEAAITLGVIGITFGKFFPTIGVLKSFRSSFFFGSIHVAILQYLLFITGVIGLTLPFPFSIIVVSLWLAGLLMTSMAQPAFVVEGYRGISSLVRSIKLTRKNFSYVFFVFVISTSLQFLLFALLFSIFMPDLNLNMAQNESKGIQILLSNLLSNPQINIAIRMAQYLVSIFFYPFASLICTLLYFDLLQKEKVLNIEQLEILSSKLFGTPIVKKEEEITSIDEDNLEPKDKKIIDSNSSSEKK